MEQANTISDRQWLSQKGPPTHPQHRREWQPGVHQATTWVSDDSQSFHVEQWKFKGDSDGRFFGRADRAVVKLSRNGGEPRHGIVGPMQANIGVQEISRAESMTFELSVPPPYARTG